ncbi:MAG TPA: hypothetical protein VH573_09735 [Mycobacteriales bacterium]|jgi:hypothetical protein
MTVRWRFEADAFLRSWSGFDARPAPVDLENVREERRLGAATLALLGARREYWVALGLIAGYAQEQDESIPFLVERLAPTGELPFTQADEVVSWATAQEFAGELDIPAPVLSAAIYSVVSGIRPDALAAAADDGAAFQLCYDTYKPDMDRVMACYWGQISS